MEKIVQMHEEVHPYEPDEYYNDVMYAPQTESQVKEARMIKQTIQTKRSRMLYDLRRAHVPNDACRRGA
ncbi:hypothetical protein PF005_g18941 [Phytophthora fragariae]|uniref:Uncharacterized protein n=1 Tax=Phytophthora fragariae TaxID=53985 RepID=A0A6A3E776_9STRA|nr:hypothetical protein PF009_g20447 [Phytophthora fragariae]KAE9090177.1 hypothetical protein PF007_g19334 [Phytophthora fragariae]KAE9120172.1 hypothetical protein PF006_g18188 [Phytophthora fragariae]KAE9191212.1 hypothetical protein PF005_g18941 [Phytophthora fragariae]KAE9203525.1 hypothetical protein PF004_g18110 [Phytophthora fragariae]